jgi:hypothetical protein
MVYFSETGYAQEGEQAKILVKDVTGEVGFVDKNLISIIYKREEDEAKEYEIALYVNEGVILENITDNDLQKLNAEDIVRVEYTEIEQNQITRREAKRIRFIRKKPLSLNFKGLKP